MRVAQFEGRSGPLVGVREVLTYIRRQVNTRDLVFGIGELRNQVRWR